MTRASAEDEKGRLRVYAVAYAALIVLLAATVGASQLSLGVWGTVVWLVIAVLKALIVALYFMHLRYTEKMNVVSACAGGMFVAILLAGVVSDALAR